MKRIFLLFLLLQASLSFATPATVDMQQQQLDKLEEIEVNTSTSGSNASVGVNNAASPTSSTLIGAQNGGNLVPLKADGSGNLLVSGGVVSHPYAWSAYSDFGSTNVTTGAWVQLVASTAAASSLLTVAETCGEVLELGTGGSGSETRVLLIPRGGIDSQVQLNIAASTRISVRAVSGNCTSAGSEIVLTGVQ